jgi:hypothetical protein
MSQLGQKRTLKRLHPMSALHSIADIRYGDRNVRFGANSRHCRFQDPGERLAMMLTTLNVITTSPA